MVGTFRLLACISISFSLLALNACGGGGGGGGGNTAANPPPPVIPAGSFLAAPGATCSSGTPCTGPESSFSFTSAVFTASDAGSSSGATVTLTTDPATGRATSVTLNVPKPTGAYVHPFDLTNAFAAPGGLSGFAAVVDGQIFSDGSSANNFIFDPTLTYSSYGVWANITNVDASQNQTGVNGVVAFGQLTPASALGSIPKTGNLTYNGRTIGVVLGDPSLGPTGGPLGLVGTTSLTANFTTMMISGSFNLNAVNSNGVVTPSWGTLNLPSTTITNANGFPYTGSISGTGGGTALNGTLFGNFYGPVANETAGTWSVAGGTIHAAGAYGAKR